jgi:CRISPR-associated protein Cmr6
MGQPHPIENGFAWHRTLGTPYLPGSGVKGLVLAYARDWWNWPAHRNRDADIRRIFGAGPENPQGDDDKQRGSVIFLDALPIEPVQLAPEVMTPHGPGSGEPQETANPTPIGFLTVKQATFDFGLLPARSYMNFTPLNTSCEPAEQAVEDCGLVSDWLQTALSLLGAGAKTRSGFGRMVADTQPAHGTVIARPD